MGFTFRKYWTTNYQIIGKNLIKDKVVIFGNSSLAKDIKVHLQIENENFIHVTDNIDFEDEVILEDFGIGVDIHKVFALMDSLEQNIFLILSICSMDKNVEIFAKSQNINETKKLKLAGANTVLDYNQLISHEFFNLIQQPNATQVLDNTIFTETGVQIFETSITLESKYLNIDISKIELENSILLGAVLKSGEFVFSQDSYILNLNDTLIFIYE